MYVLFLAALVCHVVPVIDAFNQFFPRLRPIALQIRSKDIPSVPGLKVVGACLLLFVHVESINARC